MLDLFNLLKAPKKYLSAACFEELDISYLMRQTIRLSCIHTKGYDHFLGFIKGRRSKHVAYH